MGYQYLRPHLAGRPDHIHRHLLHWSTAEPACVHVPVWFVWRLGQCALAEFREAAMMTGPVRGMVDWMMVKPTALGARVSPLNNRFPITIREAAMAEAQSLMEEKIKL